MKKGNLLLIIITLLIILIVCAFALLIKLREPKIEIPVIETHIGEPLKEVTDRNNYYIVKNCVNKFYKYCANLYENKNKQEEDIEKVYNLLDEKYIKFKSITKENLPDILQEVEHSIVNISEMYVSNQSETISVYVVNGILREEESKKLSEFQIMIQIDSKNETFSVLLEDYLKEKHKDMDAESNFTIETLNNIQKNRNNQYVIEDISDETYVKDLFSRYKEELLYNTELAYNHLDKDYREKKFGTFGKFSKFVEENIEQNQALKITKYQKNEKNSYTQYVCIDQNGYYYIFNETGLMKYALFLDTYTIDSPEFLQKYYEANTIRRVGYNIQRCIDAINYKDYAYVYSKLAFEFKAVNYPIIENFELDIKNNLFSRNEVKSVSTYYEGSTHIYKLVITDVEDNTKEKNMTVIMQLKEGTDFVMSFSFE